MITIILSVLVFVAFSQSLNEIRDEFHSVVLNPEHSKNFHAYLEGIERPSTTIQAYQAVSEALLAQVVWNPFSKLKQVVKYDKQMADAVKNDPQNIEIRFLRLAIEYNLPSFLGMSTHLDEDVEKIVSNLSNIREMQINPKFGQYIFHFLEETNLCTPEQLAQMKRSFQQQVTVVGLGE